MSHNYKAGLGQGTAPLYGEKSTPRSQADLQDMWRQGQGQLCPTASPSCPGPAADCWGLVLKALLVQELNFWPQPRIWDLNPFQHWVYMQGQK